MESSQPASPAQSGDSTSSFHIDGNANQKPSSVTSKDSTKTSFPFPFGFDSREKATGEKLAITVKEGAEGGGREFVGHIARFHVGDFVLMKGHSVDSASGAMANLFSKVHELAEWFRAKNMKAGFENSAAS
jgi:hypothetical protein